MCLFYYLLHLSSFAPTPFLLFLPCIILLCVSCVCTYPLRDEGHGLKGLHCFFILPHGLVHWLDRNSYPFNLLGFCPYCFSFYYAYRPTGCHFYNIGLLGFLSLFLGFHGPFTLLLPILCSWVCWLLFLPYWPIGIFTSFLGLPWPIYFHHASFTSFLFHLSSLLGIFYCWALCQKWVSTFTPLSMWIAPTIHMRMPL